MIPLNKIDETGAWKTDTSYGHCFDASLCNLLTEFVKDKTVLDMGCGMGDYTKSFTKTAKRVVGIDGNPNTVELTGGIGKVQNFTEDFDLGEFDWVVCLEVGEHIPEKYQSVFQNNVIKHAKDGIIISWAIPGQGGDGHVYEQPNSEIISIFEQRGFVSDDEQAKKFRNSATNAWWFKNTILVFRKKETL